MKTQKKRTESELVSEWLEARNENTVRNYMRAITWLKEYGVSPTELLELYQNAENDYQPLIGKVEGFLMWLETKNVAQNTRRVCLYAIRDFGARLSPKGYREIPKGKFPTVGYKATRVKRELSLEDIQKLWIRADLFGKVCITLQAQSGQSIREVYEFVRSDSRVVKMYRGKEDTSYRTVLSQEGFEIIEAYCTQEKIAVGQPLFSDKMKYKSFCLRWQRALKELADLCEIPRNEISPHSLRELYTTIVSVVARNPTYSDYTVGHKGKMDNAYVKMPNEMLQSEYEKIEPHLLLGTYQAKSPYERIVDYATKLAHDDVERGKQLVEESGRRVEAEKCRVSERDLQGAIFDFMATRPTKTIEERINEDSDFEKAVYEDLTSRFVMSEEKVRDLAFDTFKKAVESGQISATQRPDTALQVVINEIKKEIVRAWKKELES